MELLSDWELTFYIYFIAIVYLRFIWFGMLNAVIDTIGAGDTFAAALITQLLENSWINKNALENLSSDDLTEILTNCSAASAITCSRQGANPPHRHEVSW